MASCIRTPFVVNPPRWAAPPSLGAPPPGTAGSALEVVGVDVVEESAELLHAIIVAARVELHRALRHARRREDGLGDRDRRVGAGREGDGIRGARVDGEGTGGVFRWISA